jgi:hypothetical protein
MNSSNRTKKEIIFYFLLGSLLILSSILIAMSMGFKGRAVITAAHAILIIFGIVVVVPICFIMFLISYITLKKKESFTS